MLDRVFLMACATALLFACATPYHSMSPMEQSGADIETARKILIERRHPDIDALGEMARAVERSGGIAMARRVLAEDPGFRAGLIASARDYKPEAHDPSWRVRHAHILWVLSDTVLPEVRGDAQRIESIAIDEIRSGGVEVTSFVDVDRVRVFADPSVKFDALARNLATRPAPNVYLANIVGSIQGVNPAHPTRQWLADHLPGRTWASDEIFALKPLGIPAVETHITAMETPVAGKDAEFAAKALDFARKDLKDPFSVRYRNVFLSRPPQGLVVCGELNAKNSYGAYVGFQRFYSTGSLFSHDNAPDSRSRFDHQWQALCASQIASVPTPGRE